jgi:outer membrane protein TolC
LVENKSFVASTRDAQGPAIPSSFPRRCRFLAGLALIGTNCVDAPPEPLDPGRMLERRTALTLDDPGYLDLCRARSVEPPAAAPMRELTLAQATLATLHFRPELEIARARVAAAQAHVTTASTLQNPSLAVTPTRVTSTDLSPWLFTVTADVLLPFPGKRSKAIAVAEQEMLLAEFDAAQQTWQLLVSVRDAWTESSLAQRELALAEQELQARSEVAGLAGLRLASGTAMRSESATAELELARARTQVANARKVASLARIALAAACGLPLAAVTAPAELPPAAEEGDGGEPLVPDRVVLDRLDVRRAVAEYEAAERTLRLELAKQYPDLHLLPGYEYDQGEHKYSLGIGFDLPIFDRNQGPIAQAIARRREAAAAVERTQSLALEEFARARDGLVSARAASAAAEAEVARADDFTADAERAFANGASDRGEVAAARLVALAARRERLAAERALRRARADLEDARQRPLDPILSSWAGLPTTAGAAP